LEGLWLIRERNYTMPAIGSVRLGSLFLTLPTRALTGQQIISSEGQRASSRHVRRLFAEPSRPCGLEHRGHAVVELGAQFSPTVPSASPHT
jgi:hypothetical protein